jgi:hypothetical protein
LPHTERPQVSFTNALVIRISPTILEVKLAVSGAVAQNCAFEPQIAAVEGMPTVIRIPYDGPVALAYDWRGHLNARQIADQIEFYVRSVLMGYSNWTIGITDDPRRRMNEHQRVGRDVRRWRYWQTASEEDARAVESYFIKLGMDGGVGGDTDGRFVYIF